MVGKRKVKTEPDKFSELLNGKRPLADAQLIRDIMEESQHADAVVKQNDDDETPEPGISVVARVIASKDPNNESTLGWLNRVPRRVGSFHGD